jgi:hypothetical protein
VQLDIDLDLLYIEFGPEKMITIRNRKKKRRKSTGFRLAFRRKKALHEAHETTS